MNRRHSDYEPLALPTELHRRGSGGPEPGTTWILRYYIDKATDHTSCAGGTRGHYPSPFTESNRRPSPYHGDALPTELKGPGVPARSRGRVLVLRATGPGTVDNDTAPCCADENARSPPYPASAALPDGTCQEHRGSHPETQRARPAHAIREQRLHPQPDGSSGVRGQRPSGRGPGVRTPGKHNERGPAHAVREQTSPIERVAGERFELP